jgi:small ligand-binding sensory domain FIST
MTPAAYDPDVAENASNMRFFSAVSDRLTSGDAVAQAIDQVRSADLARVDVAMLFVTADHADSAEEILSKLHAGLSPALLVGCTGEGVIGAGREIERSPGLSLLVGELGENVRASATHVGNGQWEDVLDDQLVLSEALGHGEETRLLVGFGDPWTTPLDPLMHRLDQLKLPLVGGMASAARRQGENRLFLNDRVLDEGFVGVSFSGALDVETIVSQGCRPVGPTFVVTKAQRDIIEQLGGRPALTQLRATIDTLPQSEKELLGGGLFIGRAISEYREKFGRGDFLIRSVTGIYQDSGAIAAADVVRVGQTVQFHVRDAATAEEDLRLMLKNDDGKASDGPSSPACALLFSCNGRGTRMFPEFPGHDSSLVRAALGENTPVVGFFAAGELGPVAGSNFIHGHTASIAVLRSAT